MNLRLALMSVALCAMGYGCATPEQPATADAAAQKQPTGSYRTGSRLPSYDTDGLSSTNAMSKDEFNDQMNRGIRPGQSN